MTKVLLVCNAFDDKWIGGLVRSVKCHDNSICFDVFNVNSKHCGTVPYSTLCNKIYWGHQYFPKFLYRIPKVRALCMEADNMIGVRKLVKLKVNSNEKYDIVSFHFLLSSYVSYAELFRKIANKIVLSPWGSDVLRASNSKLRYLKKLVDLSDYVTCDRKTIRFYSQVKTLMQVPETKFVDLNFGTEMIDYLANMSVYEKEVSKQVFGMSGKYVIVCGYNASPDQNHIKIIDAIYNQMSKLPENLAIILPMTYGGSSDYFDTVENKLRQCGITYKILKSYLSNDNVAHIRICADMFIHAQKTDANSGSVSEHLLCKTKVINASWLAYSEWEVYGLPYYVFNNFNELGETIVKAYEDKSCIIDDRLIYDIKKRGWSVRGKDWCDFFNSCVQ